MKRNRLSSLVVLVVVTFACAAGRAAPPVAKPAGNRPNFVVFYLDDLHWRQLSLLRDAAYDPAIGPVDTNYAYTPRIDALARSGLYFRRPYVSSSVCMPSRYSALTGKYATRCGGDWFLSQSPPGYQSIPDFNTNLSPREPSLPLVLQRAGYATGMVGKWHLTAPYDDLRLHKLPAAANPLDPKIQARQRENQRIAQELVRANGFDYAASIYVANPQASELVYHHVEWVTKGALDFLETRADKPFFLYIAHTVPHAPDPNAAMKRDPRFTPAGVLDEPLTVQPPRDTVRPRALAGGAAEEGVYMTWLDDGIGAVLDKLDALGLRENIVIIFYNDNAPSYPPPGGKSTNYERGARSIAFVAWPGTIKPGRRTDRLVNNVDIAPTIFDLAGVTPPADMPLDGRSWRSLFAGDEKEWRTAVYLEMYFGRAVVTDRWKYIATRVPSRIGSPYLQPNERGYVRLSQGDDRLKAYPGAWDGEQLYDLAADPMEQRNLATDPTRRDVLDNLRRELRGFLATFPGRPFGEFTDPPGDGQPPKRPHL